MICTDCQAATITLGRWRRYNSPQCLHCTARLIQQLTTLRTPTSDQIVTRRRLVLQDAIDWGHSELEIRKLAKMKVIVVQPIERKRK
jgi:hypothetical protein